MRVPVVDNPPQRYLHLYKLFLIPQIFLIGPLPPYSYYGLMLDKTYLDYQITDDIRRMNFVRIQSWLTNTYWVPGITLDEVEKSGRNSSLVVGALGPDKTQVGYLRVVSDKFRFAYLMDVYTESTHRKKGLATAMIRFAFDHPDFQTIQTWLLATRDSQPVYEPLGFKPLEHPERWMAITRAWRKI